MNESCCCHTSNGRRLLCRDCIHHGSTVKDEGRCLKHRKAHRHLTANKP